RPRPAEGPPHRSPCGVNPDTRGPGARKWPGVVASDQGSCPTVLITIATTAEPATDLGFLLHKNPGRPQAFDVSVGTAHVFYPEATDQRCTAALLLEVDPIALVRGRKGPSSEAFSLGQYVNDRPYAASSMLAVAMAKV